MADRVRPSDERTDFTFQEFGEAEGPELARGTFVGRYTVLELLGRGGMGAVYKAYDPELDRSIALKVISPQSSESESTVQAHGRVMREAQALAQLSHPNVVAVYDVGKYAGSVYIAMELVEGKSGRDWLKDERPSRKEILEVFRQAGEGLLAAHQAGLVHRDFKPANMILGLDGRVRVADFGLVRSLSAPTPLEMEPIESEEAVRASDLPPESGKYLSANLTMPRSFLGTPHYMSPEQFLGKAIDGRTDQYSFCVCLFEAFFGDRPYRGKNLSELIGCVVASRRRALPAGVLVPEWLQGIIDKGLSREPMDRYPSMRELLDALAADPEEAAQRARAARRRSLQHGGFGALLATGIVLAGVFMTRGKELCRGGEDLLAPIWNEPVKTKVREAFVATGRSYAADTFGRVSSHLDRWALEWVGMHREACESTHVLGEQSGHVLDLRMDCLRRKLGSLKVLVELLGARPDGSVVDRAVEASLGLEGVKFCADVKALVQEEPPPESVKTRMAVEEIRSRLEKVRQLQKLGKFKAAEALLDEVATLGKSVSYEPVETEIALAVGLNLERLGNFAESEEVIQKAFHNGLKRKQWQIALQAAQQLTYLVGYQLQRYVEGITYAKTALGLSSGLADEREAVSINNLAIIYYDQGKYPEAELEYRRALSIREEVFGPDHPYVAGSINNLAILTESKGNYAKAEAMYRRALAINERALGPEHPVVAAVINNLAVVLVKQGKHRDAEAANRRALKIRELALGPDHPNVAASLHNLATSVMSQGRIQEAELIFEQAKKIWEAALGPDHPQLAHALFGLASVLVKQHREEEAIPNLERAHTIRHKAMVAPDLRAEVDILLARTLWELRKDRSRARAIAKEAVELLKAAGPGSEKNLRDAEGWMAEHR